MDTVDVKHGGNKMKFIKFLLIAAGLKILLMSAFFFANSSHANVGEAEFKALSNEFWQEWLKADPLLGVSKGHKEFETLLPNPSQEGRYGLIEKLETYQSRLNKIKTQDLSEESMLNHSTMSWILEHEMDRLSSPLTLLQFHTVYSWLDRYNATYKSINWNDSDGAERYQVHLKGLITYIHNQKKVLEEGLKSGYTQQCEATQKFVVNLESRLKESAFEKQLSSGVNPSNPSYKHVVALSQQAQDAMKEYTAYLRDEYAPKCRQQDGIWAWKNGDEIYEKATQYYTSTNLSADEIHSIGLNEVKRIREEVERLRTSEEVQGIVPTKSLDELLVKMRTDKIFFASSREEILERATKVMESVKKGMKNQFEYPDNFAKFNIASIPEAIEKDSAVAFYYPNGNEGTLYFNTYKPETRKTFSIASVAIHEGIPGHHYQMFSLLNNKNDPKYRQEYYFHASGEGFALYTESLIDDIYPEMNVMDKLGVLSMELLRAGRLVVDSGMHAKRWSSQKAKDFLLANTAMSEHEVDAEVSRFISYPAQATAYKIGQLEIMDMRQKAEALLGHNFDAKAFHTELVSKTSLPILVLKEEMLKWSNSMQAKVDSKDKNSVTKSL